MRSFARSSGSAAIAAVMLYAALWGVLIWGYVWNIIKLVGAVAEPITAMFVLRCVGAVAAPLGVVLGFL